MQQIQRRDVDDLVVLEHHRKPHIIVSIPTQYALANRRDANGNRRKFSGRLVNISVHAMTLVAPANGAIGERVITHCDEFGKTEGSIARLLDCGFVMTIAATDEERAKLADKIDWYEKNKNHDIVDARLQKRVVPKNPRSTLFLADDSQLECFIIDMSASGAAVSTNIKPEIGTPLAVGTIVGRVVRHLADGFAMRFIQLQDTDGLEQRLTQPRLVPVSRKG